MTPPAVRVAADALRPDEYEALDRNGFIILRGAIPAPWLDDLRGRFERGFLPHDKWPVPRERDTRHAVLYGDALVGDACLLPPVVAAVGGVLKRRFFFDWVQGRDPEPGGGAQALHRDWPQPETPNATVTVLGFLDDYGAANGGTRVVPGSHRHNDEPEPDTGVTLEGGAGDVLVFGGRLIHSGTRNVAGHPRRTLQMCFSGIELLDPRRGRPDLPPLEEGPRTFYDPA